MEQWETIIIRLRTMPFKTKLTPNYKMNWGHNFPKAIYPQREKKPMQVFNIKDFVTKKREEKINGMLNGDSGNNDGGMPFNPFMPSRPSIPGMPSSKDDDFNVDELVKRIDAKIAELEEEERREQEKESKINSDSKNSSIDTSILGNVDIKDNSSIEIDSNNKNTITDDQFFDDFFDDE